MAEEYDIVFDRESLLSTATVSTHSKKKTRQRVITTLCLCAAFFTLGLCIAMPGTTLIDLQESTETNGSQIASIFTGRSTGYLVGSVVGGCMFDRVNQALLLALTLLLTSFATAVIPFSHNLPTLIAMIFFQGISMGFLDTGGNVALLHTWGRDSSPYMQAIHFSFGLGAFVAPLIAETFLVQRLTYDNLTLVHVVSNNATRNNSSVDVPFPFIMCSYFVVSVMLAFVGLSFCSIWCFIEKCVRQACVVESTLKSEYTVREDRMCFRIQMLLLLFLFYFLYVGLEVTYGAFIATFAVKHLQWDKARATWLISVFWGTFAVARGMSIPAAHCVSPTQMLITDLVLSTVALSGLVVGNSLVTDTKTYELIVWTCTGLLGIGMASIFPAGISWVERYVHVTGKAAAVFVVGSALGEMVLPFLTGFLVTSLHPMWLMYIELVGILANVVLFIVMWKLAYSVGERYQKLSVGDDTQPLTTTHVDDDDNDEDSNTVDSHGNAKKHVTFDLVSASSQTRPTTIHSNKSSILKTKSTVKKD
jgi:FHS family Na+ dependent glucose MFS transporter 1